MHEYIIELCDNLDNKIIDRINFIMINYIQHQKCAPGVIMEQDMHIRNSCTYVILVLLHYDEHY